jgi:hypothetical protein
MMQQKHEAGLMAHGLWFMVDGVPSTETDLMHRLF